MNQEQHNELAAILRTVNDDVQRLVGNSSSMSLWRAGRRFQKAVTHLTVVAYNAAHKDGLDWRVYLRDTPQEAEDDPVGEHN